MYAREKLEQVATWLSYQNEHLSSGLKNGFDALRLFDYATAHSDTLPEMADDWEPEEREAALGYDPLSDSAVDGIYREPEETGAAAAVRAMEQAIMLLDSVAFVANDGDTKKPLKALREVLSH